MRLVALAGLAAVASAESEYPQGQDRYAAIDNEESKVRDHQQAVASYRTKLAGWKSSSMEKMRTMSPEDAMKKLSPMLSEEEKEHMTALIQNTPAPKEAKVDKLTRAVQVLNKMFLRLDKERVLTETACVVDLELMYKTDGQYHYQWQKYMYQRSSLHAENGQLTNEIADTQRERDRLEFQYDQEHAANMAMQDKKRKEEYFPAQADVELFEFIADEVDSNCGKGDTFKGLVQTEENSEACIEGASISEALLSVFADPKVKQKIASLPLHKRKRVEEELESLGMDESDDAASFVQISQKPGGKKAEPVVKDVGQSKWASNSACGSSKVSCDDLRSIVGVELVCKRRVRDLEAAELEEMEEKHKNERDEDLQALATIDAKIKGMREQIQENENAAFAAQQQAAETSKALWAHIQDTVHREAECHERLAELYENNYCSCGALRGFMFKAAVKEFTKGPPKDYKGPKTVKDCEWDANFSPQPDCMLEGKQIDCIEGDKMHHDPARLPTRVWTREVTSPNNTHPLSLGCPDSEALQMKITCNNFLCPIDCVQSGWTDSDCSTDCARTSDTTPEVTRTRSVLVEEKYKGKQCGPEVATTACKPYDLVKGCPRDCLQRFRPLGCAEACNSGSREEKVRFGRSGMRRVWNRVLKKKVVWPPKNGGKECEPEGKGLYAKAWSPACSWRTRRRCSGSEVCTDQRDILIAYECSSGMQDGYFGSACRMATGLVIKMLNRMYADYMSIPKIRVAIVKFGNGKTEATSSGGQIISDVEVMSGWTSNLKEVANKLDNDDAIWNPKSPWHWGFANFNRLFEKADKLFNSADDSGASKRKKSMVVLTKGKRADCALTMHEKAKDFHKRNIEVHVQLFAHDYQSDPGKYAVIRDVASYPADIHFAAYKGYDWLFIGGFVEKLMPKLCKTAFPRRNIMRGVQRSTRLQLIRPLHMARQCKAWKKDLFRMRRLRRWQRRGLGACARLANRFRYKGALLVRGYIQCSRGRCKRMPDKCLVDNKGARMPQVNGDGTVNDATCGCSGRDGRPCGPRNKRSQIKGWKAQDVDIANARQWAVVHFRTPRDGTTPVKFDQIAGQAGRFDSSYAPAKK